MLEGNQEISGKKENENFGKKLKVIHVFKQKVELTCQAFNPKTLQLTILKTLKI